MHNVGFMKDSVMHAVSPGRATRRPRPRLALPGSIAAGAHDLSVHFEGLANPTRLMIVERLATTPELRVSELAISCQVSQPLLSWHLRILRKAQIIRTRREGREVFCRLDREAIADHMQQFTRLIAFGGAQPAEQPATNQITEGSS